MMIQRTIALACCLGLLSACAVSYTDSAGVKHVIGLVDVAIAPQAGKALAGDIVGISTIGLSVLADERVASVALGYNRVTTAAFRDHALAYGPFDKTAFAPHALEPSAGD